MTEDELIERIIGCFADAICGEMHGPEFDWDSNFDKKGCVEDLRKVLAGASIIDTDKNKHVEHIMKESISLHRKLEPKCRCAICQAWLSCGD